MSDWGEIGVWLWTQREHITGALRALKDWFRTPRGDDATKRGILVLGAGGTGKTTLAKILAGEYEPLFDAAEPYAESIGIEEYSLADDAQVEVVVPPGQSHRRESTWDDLLAALARGEYRGVMLVNAFGYHALGEISAAHVATTTTVPASAEPLVEESPASPIGAAPEEQEFLSRYLQHQQDDELRILRKVLHNAGRSGQRTWLLSVVTKRDLWWPQQAAVEYYYREGAYGRLLRDAEATVNRQLFRHEFVFLSLTINRFITGQNEVLQNNAAGYDHPLHYQSLRRLFETVKALRDWESVK